MTTKRIYRWLIASASISFLGGFVWAAPMPEKGVPLDRDATFERNLRWEASADKAITPAKVLRWMRGLRGETLSAPSPTEFQPIVDANNSQLRVVAAIAYKF